MARRTIEDVAVDATRGYGIDALDLARLEVSQVRLVGPVTPENVDSIPLEVSPATSATHGLRARCVDDAEIQNLEIAGWALHGVMFVRGRLDWSSGSVRENYTTSVALVDADATVADVEVSRTLAGLRLIPATALFTARSRVDTSGLRLTDGEGFGALHASSGEVLHRAIHVAGHYNAGMWLQDADSVAVEGPNSVFEDNSFAGIVATQSRGLRIEDATIARTSSAVRLSGTVGTVTVGDGLHIVRDTGSLEVRRVRFEDNERSSAFIDGVPMPLTFEDVTVTPATARILVTGMPPAGWADGISPPEAAVMREPCLDPLGTGCEPFEIVSVIAPTDLPPVEIRCGP